MVHAESERDTARPQFPDRGVLDEGHVFLRDVAHWGVCQSEGHTAKLSRDVKAQRLTLRPGHAPYLEYRGARRQTYALLTSDIDV
jgi:hypothetical protein